ncbi:MAG TPA: hypothetical protein VHR55_06730 [Candidatus Limnocylindria bacterium]|nr:hypothetical protein [Candidatus Limnocylindria bacterium]
MTHRGPDPEATTPHRADDRVDLFNCRTCARFTRSLIPDRGWCTRDGAPKLIEVTTYMKHCWQARRA